MKKLLLFSLLAGFAVLELSAQSKCSNHKVQVIETKSQLNLPSFRPDPAAGIISRNSNLCSYSFTFPRTEPNAHQIRVAVKHTLFVDADRGDITIKGCRTEDVAYFVEGVRIRAGKVNLVL